MDALRVLDVVVEVSKDVRGKEFVSSWLVLVWKLERYWKRKNGVAVDGVDLEWRLGMTVSAM